MATNFGQMLAATQAYGTPEQQRQLAQSQSQTAGHEVEVQKKSQQQELQALMEAELAKASDSGGWGMLGDLGKVLSFIPAVGTGVGAGLQALSAAGTAGSQKSKLEKLLAGDKFKKYKGTYLGDPTKAFMKDVKGLAGDIDPLTTGLSSLATSMVTGKIAKGIGEKVKGAFTGTSLDKITKQGLEDNPWLTQADEFGDIEWTGDIASLDKGPLQRLFKDFDIMEILGEAGGEKGMENLQAMPLLMQLFGGGGGGQESNINQYFGN